MTNAEKLKEMLNDHKIFAKFLAERDCPCWECFKRPESCDNSCVKSIEKFLDMEYEGQYDLFTVRG